MTEHTSFFDAKPSFDPSTHYVCVVKGPSIHENFSGPIKWSYRVIGCDAYKWRENMLRSSHRPIKERPLYRSMFIDTVYRVLQIIRAPPPYAAAIVE